MTKSWILACAIFFCLYLGNARAGEMVTECPSTKPDQPEVKFKYGRAWPAGVPLAGGANEYEGKDGLLYTKDIYSTQPLYNSFLMCEYWDGAKIQVSIPGGLLHCGMVIREISRKPPIKKEWLRVWCVSDVR